MLRIAGANNWARTDNCPLNSGNKVSSAACDRLSSASRTSNSSNRSETVGMSSPCVIAAVIWPAREIEQASRPDRQPYLVFEVKHALGALLLFPPFGRERLAHRGEDPGNGFDHGCMASQNDWR